MEDLTVEKSAKTIIALGDGLRLAVEVESVSNQGLRLRSLDIQRPRTSKFFRQKEWVIGQMRALAKNVHLWNEPLEVVDYDPIRELGLLRSNPPSKGDWKEYFELSLDQGSRLVLRRFAYDRGQNRKVEIGFGLTREDLMELVDELGRTLRETPERVEDELGVQAA
jgi:hypothetical protein